MKKILLAILLLFNILSVTAQEKIDSIEVKRDTINLRGFVYDKYDNPLSGVTVSSDHASTKTLKNGYFELKGFQNKSILYFMKDSLASMIFNNDSRFIIHHLAPLSTQRLTTYDKIKAEAKRIHSRQLVNIKVKNNGCEGCFITYESPATYPGGIDKFFTYIQKNLKYPEKAISNNIEGLVILEFDVKNTGETGNFKVIRDIGYDCSEVLIGVIKKSRKWNASMINGKAISQRFSIEIPFKLLD